MFERHRFSIVASRGPTDPCFSSAHKTHTTNSKCHLLQASDESGCRVVNPARRHTTGVHTRLLTTTRARGAARGGPGANAEGETTTMMGCRAGHDTGLRLLLEHGGRAPRGHGTAAAAAAGAGGPPPVPGPHLLVARPRLVRGRGGPRSSSPRGPKARCCVRLLLAHGAVRGRAPGRGRRARAHAADEQRRAVARLLARARARGRGRAGRAGRAAPGRRARAPGRRARPARARRARRRLHKGRDDAALAGARARSPVLHRPARALATRCIAGFVGCIRPVSTSYCLEADRPVALHLSVSPSLVPRRTQRDRSLADKNQRPPLLRPAAARLLPAASCRRCFLHDARPPTGWGRRGDEASPRARAPVGPEQALAGAGDLQDRLPSATHARRWPARATAAARRRAVRSRGRTSRAGGRRQVGEEERRSSGSTRCRAPRATGTASTARRAGPAPSACARSAASASTVVAASCPPERGQRPRGRAFGRRRYSFDCSRGGPSPRTNWRGKGVGRVKWRAHRREDGPGGGVRGPGGRGRRNLVIPHTILREKKSGCRWQVSVSHHS